MFLIRFILFFILIYLILTSLGRFIFGLCRNSRMSGRDNSDTRREGDVTIQYGEKNKKKISKDTGEYINYEEVDKR